MAAMNLDYLSPPDAGFQKPTGITRLFICCALAGVAIFTCTSIEILDYQAGHILAQRTTGEPHTWRVSFVQSERSWRKLQEIHTGDPTLATRRLTSAEAVAMKAEVSRNVANERLCSFMMLGLLQYPIVVALLVLSVRLFRRHGPPVHQAIAVGSTIAAVLCGAMMLYRGYFTCILE